MGLLELRVGLLELRVGLLELEASFLELRVGLIKRGAGTFELGALLFERAVENAEFVFVRHDAHGCPHPIPVEVLSIDRSGKIARKIAA